MTDLRTLQSAETDARRELKRAQRIRRQEQAAEELAKLAGRPGEGTPRLSMTPARRDRIIAKSEGHCAYPDCQVTTALEIDHRIPLEIGGREDDANLWALCGEHHKAKTRLDVKLIAKAKRRAVKHTEPRKPSQIKSAPFGASRGFRSGR